MKIRETERSRKGFLGDWGSWFQRPNGGLQRPAAPSNCESYFMESDNALCRLRGVGWTLRTNVVLWSVRMIGDGSVDRLKRESRSNGHPIERRVDKSVRTAPHLRIRRRGVREPILEVRFFFHKNVQEGAYGSPALPRSSLRSPTDV